MTRRLEIYADDVLVDARDLAIPAEQRSEALISSVPQAARVVEARLAGEDALAVDDRAFALVPSAGAVRALLVGPGNTYLENALALLPRLELYAVGADGYARRARGRRRGRARRTASSSSTAPSRPRRPTVPALYVGPTADGAFGTVGRVVDGPALDRTDPADPLLRFVDLSTLHIGRARADHPGRRDAPGGRERRRRSAGRRSAESNGRGVALLSFALGDSDLPLQVAFPLLISNLDRRCCCRSTDGILPPSVELGPAASPCSSIRPSRARWLPPVDASPSGASERRARRRRRTGHGPGPAGRSAWSTCRWSTTVARRAATRWAGPPRTSSTPASRA